MEDFVNLLCSDLDVFRGEYICVSNVHTCVMAHDDSSYWDVQAGSIASLPDGKPLSVIGSREVPSMGRVTGPDLMREVFTLSESREWRHYFYGNEQKNLEALRDALLAKYPNLCIVGMEPSVFRPLTDEEKEGLVDRINESGADFAWIALGAPRQERLCYELKGKTAAVMVGVGGAFNVLASIIPEAPMWMQNLSLEWLYRLLQEPRRLFKRYLRTNTKFLFYLFTGAKRKKDNR